MPDTLSDHQLARSLRGEFRSDYADVNSTRLHYVTGGCGEPLVLLGGWPQTWWHYHKIMPALAERFRVIAVDLRGMGSSAKPDTGYDKKTMADDIHELTRHLGYTTVNLAGHDIGAAVAFAFAANHPDALHHLVLLDATHPDEHFYRIPLLPQPGHQTTALETGRGGGYLWWLAFNQVRGLPEQLVQGRSRLLIDWILDFMLHDTDAISEHDRQIYAHAYNSAESLRAANRWYQAFGQDITHARTYPPITAPVLVLTTESSHDRLHGLMHGKGVDIRIIAVPASGHYLAEEQPDIVIRHLQDFME